MSKQNTNDKAEGIVDRFLASKFMNTVYLLANTGRTLLLIYVPAAIAVYLLHTQSDRLVLAIGVSLAVLSFVNTSRAVYTSEKASFKPRKQKA